MAPDGRLDSNAFRDLLQHLAAAWERQDTDAGLACFTPDAVYLEPPDLQLVQGHDQLRPYFAALEPGTFMRWHHVSFDEETQTGVGEFTFGEDGQSTADHGVCIVELRSGLIARWREYVRKGPPDLEAFLAVEGKAWAWDGGRDQ